MTGSLHYAGDRFPEAIKQFDDSLKLCKESGLLEVKRTNLRSIAKVYNKQKDFLLAID